MRLVSYPYKSEMARLVETFSSAIGYIHWFIQDQEKMDIKNKVHQAENTGTLITKVEELERQLAEAKAALFQQTVPGSSDFGSLYSGNQHHSIPASEEHTWQQYHQALSLLPEFLVIYDRNLQIQFVNQAVTEATHRPASDFLGKIDREAWSSQNYIAWQAALQAAFETGQEQSAEIHYRTEDGQKAFRKAIIIPLTDAFGSVNGVMGITENLTKSERAEQARQDVLTLLKGLTEGTINLVAAVDTNLCYTWINKAYREEFEQIFGCKITAGDSLIEALAHLPEDQENAVKLWNKALIGEKISVTGEFGDYTRERKRYEMCFSPIYDQRGSIVGAGEIATDITERVSAEEALHESEERFRFVIENSLDVAYRRNLQTDCYDYMSPVVEQVLGFTAEEMNSMTFEEISARIHSDDIVATDTILSQSIESGKGKLEYRFLTKAGEYHWLADHISLVKDKNGQPLYRSGILRDITDKKAIEQALRDMNKSLEERVRERTEALRAEIEERKQIEAELIEIRKFSIDSVEEERLQLSHEVHDGPMQELYALSYDIAQLDVEMNPDQIEAVYKELQDRILEINNSLRQISRGMRPPVLDQFGLEKAIRDYIGSALREDQDLQVRLELTSDKDRLDSRVRLALFRILQTAFGNILRHSEASLAEVRLQFKESPENTVVLEIEDHGKGFKVPERWIKLVRKGHLGLVGANERAQNIGGQLQIISSPGQGTLIRVTAPAQ